MNHLSAFEPELQAPVARNRGELQIMADPTIRRNLPNCAISLLTMETMWRDVLDGLGTAPATS